MLRPITLSGQCRGGQAGINRFATVDANDIEQIDFNADKEVVGITLKSGKAWVEMEFDQENVGFFNQALTAPRGSINWAQQVSLNFPQNNNDLWLAIEELNKYCNLVGAVLDNQGKLRFPGIQWLSGTTAAVYKKLGLKTSEGSWNTGADSSSDSNEAVIVLSCNSGSAAHFANSALTFEDLDLTP